MNPVQTIGFSAAPRWMAEAWSLWWRRPGLFIGSALMVLALRWGLDAVPVGDASLAVIFVSYLTDALIFASLWLALSQPDGVPGLVSPGLVDGWRRMKGRRGKVAKAGLWGLPSATVGFLLLSLQSHLFEAVGAVLGARLAGWLMLVWIFAVGWLSCTLLFGAIFACIEAANGEDRLWPAGMKGMRTAALGWRPLLAVWAVFVCGATFFATLSAWMLGHLSLSTLDGPARDALEYWINWPALFVAIMALLALLVPAARELIAAEEAAPGGEESALIAFEEALARRLGLALKALAAATALSGVFVISGNLTSSLTGAVCLWLTGRALAKEAAAWSDANAGFWARWRWLFLTGLPLLLLWFAIAQQ